MIPRQREGLRDKYRPFPHQEQAVQRLLANNGSLIMAHGTGTGKSGSAIFGFDRLKKEGRANKALIVVPAGLKNNFKENIEKFSTYSTQTVGPKGGKDSVYLDSIDPSKTFTIVSYAMFRQAPEKILQATGADTLVFDEYHRVRNPMGKSYRAAMSVRGKVRNFMGLTASPTNNDPVEIVPLINLSAGRELMSPAQFRSRHKVRVARTQGFFGGKKYISSLVNVEGIKRRLGSHVDFVTSDDLGKSMPRREVENVDVPMSDQQRKIYEFTLKKVGPLMAHKIRNNLPVTQKEAFHIFSMIAQARQAANTPQPFVRGMTPERGAQESPKVKRLLDDTQKHLSETPDGKVVLYSNLIKGGVDSLSAGLKARGIDHAVFVGKGREIGGRKITGDTRNQGVSDFKAGKKKVIVLSGAGAEGLDLKNATMFQALDVHFNPERIRQAEARARRLKGQEHRPPDQRVVKVKRYFSTYQKPGFFGRMFGKKTPSTTDQWIYNVAKRKHVENEKLRSAFKMNNQPISSPRPVARPEMKKIRAPTKYKRKWRDLRTGRWRYEYE